MEPNRIPPGQLKPLIIAGALEMICIIAGVAAWLATDRLIWIFIGVLAGLGFSLPAVITLIRERKGGDDASR
ncbi:MAG: hypothetical protein AAF719_12120 [Pseudomonadota bacterium]